MEKIIIIIKKVGKRSPSTLLYIRCHIGQCNGCIGFEFNNISNILKHLLMIF